MFYLRIKKCEGGIESCLFLKDMFEMYIKYLNRNKIIYNIINIQKNKNIIYETVILIINIKDIKFLRYEVGIHRVQRVPKTEKFNRIHTSIVSVDIINRIPTKDTIIINKKDIIIETFKSSGAGGQHINKTNSAVRIKHLPTGLKVECQKERSQFLNKKEGLKILENKIIYEEHKRIIENKKRYNKSIKVNTNRSNKIRTYNFKKGIVIDHINNKKYPLEKILSGQLELIYKN